MESPGDITLLLRRAADGDDHAMNDVVSRLHSELEQQAKRRLRREFGPHAEAVTLEPAALVNEVFLRLLDQRTDFENRRHFLGVASTIMLRVILNFHRSKAASKRGGDQIRVTLTGIDDPAAPGPATEAPDLVAALEELERLDARKAEVVKLRGLWGMEMQEIASTIGASLATVERDWRFGKSWLGAKLRGET